MSKPGFTFTPTPKQRDYLATCALWEQVTGLLAYVEVANLGVTDGRKVKPFKAALVAAGYAYEAPGGIRPTTKAVAELPPAEPLAFSADRAEYAERNGHQYHGESLDGISPSQMLRLVANEGGGWQISARTRWGTSSDRWTFDLDQPGALDEFRAAYRAKGLEVFVSDPAWRAAKAATIRAARIQRVRAANLAGGLREFGLVPAEDKDVFASGASGGSLGFSPEASQPEKWPEQFRERTARLRQKIADAQRQLRVLCETEERIEQFGGWTEFIRRYDALVSESVDAEAAEAAAPEPTGTPAQQ